MKKTYEQYLKMGMDEKTARYFAGGRRRVTAVVPSAGYVLTLTFDNGEKRTLDCASEFVEGSLFNRLAAPEDFGRVFVDASGNIAWDIDPHIDSEKVWSNRIDFCRDSCYLKSVPVKP